jgi:hypothetical protein
MPGPGYPFLGFKDCDDRAGPAGHGDPPGMVRPSAGIAAPASAAALRDLPPSPKGRCCAVQAPASAAAPAPATANVPRFEAISECNSSKDYIAQIGKQPLGMGVGDQQRHLFRRRQQDIGRVGALACPFGLRRVAGPGFDPNRQAHFLDRFRQVAFDVDGQCLERRDVQRVQRPGTGGARLGLAAPARSVRLGRKPASVLPAPVGAISSIERPAAVSVSSSS